MIISCTEASSLSSELSTRRQLAAEVRRLTRDPGGMGGAGPAGSGGRWYERILAGDGYEVWLISWLPGQSTGFHDHGGSAGAFGVVWGALDECVVPRSGRRARVTRVDAGEVRAFGPRYVHDVRNSVRGSVAVSVHAYSPPLSTMTRYDLTPGGLAVAGTEGAAIGDRQAATARGRSTRSSRRPAPG